MPATYLSFLIEPDMTLAEKQNKLYLGVISAGEQAYTLGAALAECRKQLTALDDLVSKMRLDYEALKAEFRAEAPTPKTCPTCDSPNPEMHPSMQPDGGEVQICRNPWHSSVATQKETK